MYSDIYVSRLLSILFCFISIISRCLCRAVEYLWTIYTMLINKIALKNSTNEQWKYVVVAHIITLKIVECL